MEEMPQQQSAIVIGAGLSGITSARALQEAGFQVELWTKETIEHTTSCVSCAFWYPYIVQPEEAALKWGVLSLNRFMKEEADPKAGIELHPLESVFTYEKDDPTWASMVPEYRRLTSEELPEGYKSGFTFQSLCIEMPIYSAYVLDAFAKDGGSLIVREVHGFDEAFEEVDVVVNCTGLGSQALCDDEDLHSVRGQVAVVERTIEDKIFFDTEGVLYISPRSKDCFLGGTAEVGAYDTEPDLEKSANIIDRCAKIMPHLKDAKVLEHKVGLRPARSSVRLEVEQFPNGKTVIHNYGHGGAGVTLCWGCAEDVAKLAQEVSSAVVA